ncbi:MAG: hypothetical protein HXY20_14235 [Acidobacteria bacterium]|nr:hypothetical protein [Acidobacteriota bacterium]
MPNLRETRLLHLHTYFLFPFSIDKRVVYEQHPEVWSKYQHWMEGLDEWIAAHGVPEKSPVVEKLGPWRRSAYSRFDMDSSAYQDMVFFHPFVRRVFFDTAELSRARGEEEALLRCYTIPVGDGRRLWFHAEDAKGRSATVEVTDLRLFLFANGIGILTIGIEAFGISARRALWINEAMRKVYPSSGRQLREGRIPNRMTLTIENNGALELVSEELFAHGEMIGFLPPLSKNITSLIYFADYRREEFEPVLDERMIVYSYFVVDPAGLPPDYSSSEAYQVLLSRFLYVDIEGPSYRYEPSFVKEQMARQMYRRWAHQGTWYGFTSYSNITATIGTFECDEHTLKEGFLVHRMFNTRYYLMALVALFYRATLLSFEERTALVSKRLFLDEEDGRLTSENIRSATDLRAEFLHFSNYWYFDELANKDEEIEHFALQCQEYRIEPIKTEIEEELDKLNAYLQEYSSFLSTEAVNRLAMLGLIMGGGAVLTGFFGMNFGRYFERLFFVPDERSLAIHYAAIVLVALLSFGAIALGFYMVIANWSDYREILLPPRRRAQMRSRRR